MKSEGQEFEYPSYPEPRGIDILSIRFALCGYILLLFWILVMYLFLGSPRWIDAYWGSDMGEKVFIGIFLIEPIVFIMGVLGIIFDKKKWPALLLAFLTSLPILLVIFIYATDAQLGAH